MRNKPTWEYITEQAETGEALTTRQLLAFEMFNPNGAYAAKKKTDALVDALVAKGEVPSGWILAHGGLNDYHYKELSKLLRKKSFVKRWTVEYHAEGLRKDAVKALEAIAKR